MQLAGLLKPMLNLFCTINFQGEKATLVIKRKTFDTGLHLEVYGPFSSTVGMMRDATSVYSLFPV